ncbi:MAG: hypothetical protein SPG57_02900 [Limosilactobacillus mucosae]|nr:tail fiber domain-containing protein [Limosilactobacillus mucosae]MDY5412803.1 hypothetical protein [Limosilactobacillus mucosae]
MSMDNVTLENTQQSISSRDAKSVASVMVNGKWVNLSDTLEQANVKSDVGTVSKQVAEQQTVITSAVAQADSAVAYANDAIEKSRVNQQAIVEINSALSDAVSDAAVARSDGLRAWNAAQSNVDLIDSNYASASAAISSARTEAIAAADEAKASASAAQADIVAVRSDVAAVQADVTANKSDVAVAKSDIAVVRTDLASQATSLSSYASQASAAGKDITVLKSQAGQFEQDMADTKGDVSQLKVSASSASAALSDAAGNISSLQASAKSYSAALSDTNSNVATVTATASELETKYADAAGDINKLQTDAKGTAQTLADAQGDIAKLKTRADGFDTQFASTNGDISKLQVDAQGTTQTLTNAQSDIAVLQSRADGFDTKFADTAGNINKLQVDATGMKQTLTDAKGNISTLQATATGFKNTLTDAQGNISTLQSDVAGLKKTTSDHAGNIATLQADAKTLTSQMADAQGNISTLQQTASGFSSKVSGMETSLANANSKISAIQTNGGGVNLAKGTDNFFESTADGYAYIGGLTPEEWKQYEGKTLTFSVTIEWKNWQTDLRNRVGWELAFNVGGKTIWDNDKYPSLWLSEADGSSGKKRLSTTITVPENIDDDAVTEQYAYIQTHGDYFKISHLMVEDGTVAHTWSPNPEDTDAKITTNATAIDQNKKAITLKADQTTVDKTNGTVQRLKAQLDVQADQINSKVSSSDLDARGYATQAYTQTQIKQASDSWNANLTSVQNGLTKSYTNLHATVDGIQAQVYNSDGSSKITQLSNLIATKVSQGDYNSQITQLKNDINLRVAKGDVVSQINQEAGGNTLIQVSNGRGKLALNASSVIFSGSAFIPDAYISTLNADKLRFYDSSGNVATMSANLVQHDDDKVARTINLQYNGGYEVHASNTLGSILTMHDDTIRLAVKSSGSSGDQYSGVYAMTHYTQLSNYRSDGSAPGVFIYDDQFNILGDANGAGTSKGDMHISSPQLYLNGSSKLQAGGDHALLTIASDYTTIHADKNVWMETGNTQLHLDNSNNLEIFNKNNTNTSNYDVHLTVRGWATFTGWVNCLGLTQTSRLSTKTNIERLDTARALELINSADVATYQYKQDVANGGTKRHASVIIDDVNDVARYQTPDEFISEDRSGRSDGDIVGYLMGAVQELTKKIKTLESKVG